jgi:uncharacterized membrane protein YgaE (UPF0421/DUF939 family)
MVRGPRAAPGFRRLGSSPDEALDRLRHRSGSSLRQRWHRTTANTVLAVQGAVAAGAAWFIAAQLLNHKQPVFAPISAVIVLDISVGQRLRRTFELVLGVALGIAIGDALVFEIGTGAWQVGLVVFLATVLAVYIAGTPAVVAQATSSSVLIATLQPPKSGILYSRFVDALIGGGVALVVLALVLPANPLAVVSRKAGPAAGVLADGLDETATALRTGMAEEADRALTKLNEGQAQLAEFRETLPESRETATVAPLRWRSRGALSRYVEAAEHLERALGNARVLARRAVTLINDGEPVPECLPDAVQMLAEATRELRQSLTRGASEHRVADMSVEAVTRASEAYHSGIGFSGSAIVAQVRAIATDLLGTADLSHSQANELVRRTSGNLAQRH